MGSGVRRDPTGPGNECSTFCAPLGRGSVQGECAEPCSGPGDPNCAPPYFCNTLLRNGQVQNVCLPNRACGGLDYYGYCQGDTSITVAMQGRNGRTVVLKDKPVVRSALNLGMTAFLLDILEGVVRSPRVVCVTATS